MGGVGVLARRQHDYRARTRLLVGGLLNGLKGALHDDSFLTASLVARDRTLRHGEVLALIRILAVVSLNVATAMDVLGTMQVAWFIAPAGGGPALRRGDALAIVRVFTVLSMDVCAAY